MASKRLDHNLHSIVKLIHYQTVLQSTGCNDHNIKIAGCVIATINSRAFIFIILAHRFFNDRFCAVNGVSRRTSVCQSGALVSIKDTQILKPFLNSKDIAQTHQWDQCASQHQHFRISNHLDPFVDLICRDMDQFTDMHLGYGKTLSIDRKQQRRDDGQSQRQTDNDIGSLTGNRIELDLSTQLIKVGLDHVHPHSAARDITYMVSRR